MISFLFLISNFSPVEIYPPMQYEVWIQLCFSSGYSVVPILYIEKSIHSPTGFGFYLKTEMEWFTRVPTVGGFHLLSPIPVGSPKVHLRLSANVSGKSDPKCFAHPAAFPTSPRSHPVIDPYLVNSLMLKKKFCHTLSNFLILIQGENCSKLPSPLLPEEEVLG